MILTEEDIAECFESVFGNGEFGMTGDLSLARAIESAVLNKLQDKLKGIYEIPNEGFDVAVDYAIEEYTK